MTGSRILSNRARLRLADREIMSRADMIEEYRRQISAYGFSPQSLFYSDAELHTAKMAQYASLARLLVQGNERVLDVGCGYGSLVPLLPPCEYVGIDLVEEFVKEARRRYPGVRFECVAVEWFTEKADWVFVPGMMGSIVDPEATVERVWGMCRRGLVVDFIDSSKYTGSSLNSYNIGACVEFLLALGSTHVEVMTSSSVNWAILVARRFGPWLSTSAAEPVR
jgi:SAM-dependent methyltransferase